MVIDLFLKRRDSLPTFLRFCGGCLWLHYVKEEMGECFEDVSVRYQRASSILLVFIADCEICGEACV